MKRSEKQYWLIGGMGVIAVAVAAVLIRFFLVDWDFYHKLGFQIGLDFEEGPLFTRVVFGNQWTLFIPAFLLLCTLFVLKEKSRGNAVIASLSAAVVLLLVGYMVAYAPVAKPDWWWGDRPEYLIEEI